jgi:hypothetical protein
MSQDAIRRREHIDKAHPLSMVRQCELLEIHRRLKRQCEQSDL